MHQLVVGMGSNLRDRMLSSSRFGAIPSCDGLITRLACTRARSTGIDLLPLLRRADLTIREINDESAPLRVRDQINCLNLVAGALSDRLLGFHLVEDVDLRRQGLLYYVAASSEFLVDALRQAARYSVIGNEGIELGIEFGKTLQIDFKYAGVSRLSDRHQIEAWITLLVRSCRQLTGHEMNPVGVRIMHQRIPESAALDRFLGCNAEFGADSDEVRFSSEEAKSPIVSADQHLNKVLIKHCEEAIASRKASSGSLRENVENAIAVLLPHGRAQLDLVAQKLGMSPRTLSRNLSNEGVTFARILEELRLALSRHYLAELDVPISRIAWLLGYTGVSAFSHAFRRWTGRAPRTDRSRRQRRHSLAHSKIRVRDPLPRSKG
jgi:AraC-like DNA-binding protein